MTVYIRPTTQRLGASDGQPYIGELTRTNGIITTYKPTLTKQDNKTFLFSLEMSLFYSEGDLKVTGNISQATFNFLIYLDTKPDSGTINKRFAEMYYFATCDLSSHLSSLSKKTYFSTDKITLDSFDELLSSIEKREIELPDFSLFD